MLLLSIIACTAPAPTTSTPTTPTGSTGGTGQTGATGDTGAAVMQPLQIRGTLYGSRLGADLRFVRLEPPLLAMSDPGSGAYDDQPFRRVYLIDPLEAQDGPISFETRFRVTDDTLPTTGLTAFGNAIGLPGDVTGDGEIDLVVYDTDADLGTAPAWLFQGPLLARKLHETEAHGIPFETEVPWRGAPCGDLTGDGIDEICTALGIVHGPINAPITAFDVSWTPGTPPEDVRIASADLTGTGPSLLVSDPTASVVHHLTTFPSGAHDLATLATDAWATPETPTVVHAGGDLDGDGLDDVVIAWGGASPSVAVSTVTGGDLTTTAFATLDVEAQAVEVADFDGDGADDLAVGGTPSTLIFLGPLAGGVLGAGAADNVLVQEDDDQLGSTLAAMDVDGDGDADLAAAARGYGDSHGYGAVYVFYDPATFSWDQVR